MVRLWPKVRWGKTEAYQQVAKQADNSNLANGGNEDGSLLPDLGAKVLMDRVSCRSSKSTMFYTPSRSRS